jgi:hypothetical protein
MQCIVHNNLIFVQRKGEAITEPTWFAPVFSAYCVFITKFPLPFPVLRHKRTSYKVCTLGNKF